MNVQASILQVSILLNLTNGDRTNSNVVHQTVNSILKLICLKSRLSNSGRLFYLWISLHYELELFIMKCAAGFLNLRDRTWIY
jgi:hypothetical protein